MDELQKRIESRSRGFAEAINELPWIKEALDKGHQFNAYDSADNDEETLDEDCDMILCIGPISDSRMICSVDGRSRANMIADALTLAAALRARASTLTDNERLQEAEKG